METCTFSAVILAYLALTFALTRNKQFENNLSDEQRSVYNNIKVERAFLFSLGVYSGLSLSLIILRNTQSNYPKCMVFALSYVLASIFYMVIPKRKYMIEELRQDQIQNWLVIYNKMKIANALFFGIAVVALIVKI